MVSIRRRTFLQGGLGVAATLALGPRLLLSTANAATGRAVVPGPGPYGPLLPADAEGVQVPAGFTARVVARGGQVVPGTQHVWHAYADGGGCFVLGDGWAYVSNSEAGAPGTGGTDVLRFDADATIVDAYQVLDRKTCAGGATPWGTWFACEEHPTGLAWECLVDGPGSGVARPALGVFAHEAVAVDPVEGRLYLTEDATPGGELYRFTSDTALPDLSSGVLEVVVRDPGTGAISWLEVDPAERSTLRRQRSGAPVGTAFPGNEGITYDQGHVFFTAKVLDQVWDLDVAAQRLDLLYDSHDHPAPVLRGVDNIMASTCGDLFVAEDGGNMELVTISAEREVAPFLRIVGQDGSELAGPAFSPAGPPRLYVSSQRGGASGLGVTYEIRGPFRPFLDVPTGHEFLEPVWFLAVNGITHGYADRTFHPSEAVSRQAMAAFLYRFAGSPSGPFPDPGYHDVRPGNPFAHEVAWLTAEGLSRGFSDGTFRPTAGVSRQAMAAFLHRFEGAPAGPFPNPGFVDVGVDHRFAREIGWLVAAGIAEGYDDGTFRPGAVVSRQAMAAFLLRYRQGG